MTGAVAVRHPTPRGAAQPRAAGFTLLAALLALLALLLAGCNRQDAKDAARPASAAAPAASASAAAKPFTILAGSEVKDLEPAMVKAAAQAGVALRIQYAGTLDIVERINDGAVFDAILPASGAYPALALTRKPVARDKIFYSRVAIGIKPAKLKALGWDRKTPTWADIAAASGKGDLRFAMTNPASSNSGMSALFAVAAAVAGKTEDLALADLDAKVLQRFLAGQRLTAGSSGWLAEAYVREAAQLDAMVNYEAVILRTNRALPEAERLQIVYPTDGVISADYPLMLLQPQRRAEHDAIVAALRAEPFQREAAAAAFLRPVTPGIPLAPGLSAAPVAELSFPNNLAVIDGVLGTYQEQWRRPATSIFVLDTSGSMKGERMDGMRAALKVLAGADARTASARYARFQSRERVWLVPFETIVSEPVEIRFDRDTLDAARAAITKAADGLNADGGTALYRALIVAEELAARQQKQDPDRFVSIVLLTDGQNNGTPDFAGFRNRIGDRPPARVFPILFGEANHAEMEELAKLTGGRVFDGRRDALANVFKEIRGYQ